MSTWSQRFDHFTAINDHAYAQSRAGDGEGLPELHRSTQAIERLLDRYRAEGYPGMDAPLPRDLLD